MIRKYKYLWVVLFFVSFVSTVANAQVRSDVLRKGETVSHAAYKITGKASNWRRATRVYNPSTGRNYADHDYRRLPIGTIVEFPQELVIARLVATEGKSVKQICQGFTNADCERLAKRNGIHNRDQALYTAIWVPNEFSVKAAKDRQQQKRKQRDASRDGEESRGINWASTDSGIHFLFLLVMVATTIVLFFCVFLFFCVYVGIKKILTFWRAQIPQDEQERIRKLMVWFGSALVERFRENQPPSIRIESKIKLYPARRRLEVWLRSPNSPYPNLRDHAQNFFDDLRRAMENLPVDSFWQGRSRSSVLGHWVITEFKYETKGG